MIDECPRCHSTRTPTNCCGRIRALEDRLAEAERLLAALAEEKGLIIEGPQTIETMRKLISSGPEAAR